MAPTGRRAIENRLSPRRETPPILARHGSQVRRASAARAFPPTLHAPGPAASQESLVQEYRSRAVALVVAVAKFKFLNPWRAEDRPSMLFMIWVYSTLYG